MEKEYSSPALAKEMESIYSQQQTEIIHVKMQHEEEIKTFLTLSEETHKKAAESTLLFG